MSYRVAQGRKGVLLSLQNQVQNHYIPSIFNYGFMCNFIHPGHQDTCSHRTTHQNLSTFYRSLFWGCWLLIDTDCEPLKKGDQQYSLSVLKHTAAKSNQISYICDTYHAYQWLVQKLSTLLPKYEALSSSYLE